MPSPADRRAASMKWLFFILTLLFVASCGGPPGPVVRESVAMNTFVSITIYNTPFSDTETALCIDSAFAEIRRIEMMATDYSDTSEIGRINAFAGSDAQEVSKELVSLLNYSLEFGRRSQGAFNIAVGPIVKAWDFLSESPRIPSQTLLDSLLPLTNQLLVQVHEHSVFLPLPRMSLDLGAIAKGYAVDRALGVLQQSGIQDCIVDIGGNLGVLWHGTRMLDSTMATVYIRHPRREGEFLGTFRMGTGGVSTSGDYQRYFMNNGIRYHHIIDPNNGYPARDVISVTIVAPDATVADALSTLVFVLGREKGMRFVEGYPGIDALVVFETGDSLGYLMTSGMKKRFVETARHD